MDWSSSRFWSAFALSAWLAFFPVWFPLARAYDVNDAQWANDLGASFLSGANAIPSVNSGVPSGPAPPGTINLRELVPGANEEQAWATSSYYGNPATLKDAVMESHRRVQGAGCPSTTFALQKLNHRLMTLELRRLVAVQDRDPITNKLLFDSSGAPLITVVVAERRTLPATAIPFTVTAFGADGEHRQIIQEPSLGVDGFAYVFTFDRLEEPSDGSYVPTRPGVTAAPVASGASLVVTSKGDVGNQWTMTGTITAAGQTVVALWVNLYRANKTFTTASGPCPADPPGCLVTGVDVCNDLGFDLSSIYAATHYQSVAYEIINDGDLHFDAQRPAVADAVEAVSPSAISIANGTNPVFAEVLGGGCAEDKVYAGPIDSGVVRFSQACFSEFMGCLGTDCHNPNAEYNGHFITAVTALGAIDQIQHDITCAETGRPPSSVYEPCTIRVFGGKHQTCKIPIGSNIGLTPDCCEEGKAAASNVDLFAYFKLVYFSQKLMRLDVVKKSFTGFPALPGWQTAYDATVGVVQGAVKATTKAFENAVSGFFQELGFKTGGDTTINLNIFSGIQQALMKALQNFLQQAFGEQFAAAIITTNPAGQLVFTGPVAWIIAIWYVYEILKIIGHIIFKCTEDELRLGISRQAEECISAGSYCHNEILGICVEKRRSYCCYKSFLSRLLMQEFRVNQNIGGGLFSYGTRDSSNPNCAGLTVPELQTADWSRVDLTPYLRKLQSAGLVPTSAF